MVETAQRPQVAAVTQRPASPAPSAPRTASDAKRWGVVRTSWQRLPGPERPARAPDVTLIGELKESAFTTQQWLVQRGDRFVQLSELLYRIVEYADGQRTLAEIAAHVSEATGRRVS